jgi:RNA-binding protein
MKLTGRQRRALRALGHSLSPSLRLGKEGLSPAIFASLEQALVAHELVKVKAGKGAMGERHEFAARLAEESRSELVQLLGGSILLFRRNPENPVVELPAGREDEGAESDEG